MIIYPKANYTSWISEDEADNFFENRLHSDEWSSANKEAALQHAFRDINWILNLDYDLSADDTPLAILKAAQCEQAHYLLTTNPDARKADTFSLGSGLYVKLGDREPDIPYKVVRMLTDFISLRTITRIR